MKDKTKYSDPEVEHLEAVVEQSIIEERKRIGAYIEKRCEYWSDIHVLTNALKSGRMPEVV